MKFSDILDLARQGYKPSDIRELLSMDTEPDNEPDTKSEHETKSEPDNEPDTKSEHETKSEPDNEPDTKSEHETKSEPDYKKMYEDTLKKLNALQKANQRQPVKEHKDTVNDIIREAFY